MRQPLLDKEPADRVAEARQQNRRTSQQRRGGTAQVETEQHGDAGQSEQHPDEAQALRALLWINPDRKQSREQRCRSHENARRGRADLLLPRGDQQERTGDLHCGDQRDQSRPPGQSTQAACARGQRNEHHGGEQNAAPGDDRRREVTQADLDEQITGTPNRPENKQQRPGAAIHPLEVRSERPPALSRSA